MKGTKAWAVMAMTAGALGAYAQTATNAIPSGLHVLQGDFESGASPTLSVDATANTLRLGYGGGTGNKRCNQPIYELDLVSIPADETLTAATLTVEVSSLTRPPIFFDALASLMTATNKSELSADAFVAATAPLDTVLSNGLVFAQIDSGDIPSSGLWEIPLKGQALAELNSLYDASGNPTQSKVFFRLSTSPTNGYEAATASDLVNFAANATNATWAAFGLELYWGEVPEDVYYVASSPTNWAVGSAWSDGNPASSNDFYVVTNNVALQTPSSTVTFPGLSLSLVDSQTVEVMATGADVITFPSLELGGDTIRAGVIDAGEAKVDGTFHVVSNSTFAGAADNTRDLRVLALVTGGTSVELSAPTKTIYIDNAANTFDGTWWVSDGTVEFASAEAIGSANIEVGSNGVLRVAADWQGQTAGQTLTVADSATAGVDLGTYEWTVASMTLGGTPVVDGTYDVDALNALGAAVFTGTGSLRVGAVALGTGLVAHWKLDEGSGTVAADSTTYGFTGDIQNGATWASDAERDSYLVFDGTDDRVSTPFTYALSSTDSFTWAFWANSQVDSLDNSQKNAVIVGNRYPQPGHGGETYEFIKCTPQQMPFSDTNDPATIEKYNYADLPVGEWHHYVMTKDGTTCQWYVDGVAAGAPMTVNYSEDTPIPFFIGGDPGTGNATEHFNGYIDDVALFNVALTSNQVATVYGGDYSDWYGPSEAPVIGCTISGGDMIVTWDATGFKLQIRESLQFGDWVDYPGGDSSPVTVPATNDVEFMRLIEQ